MPRKNLTESGILSLLYPERLPFYGLIPTAPLTISCSWLPWRYEVTQEDDLFWQRPGGGPLDVRDGHAMSPMQLRGAFEEVRKPKELAAFLSIAGPFREVPEPKKFHTWQSVSWPEFLEWQKYIRAWREGKRPPTPPPAHNVPDPMKLRDPEIIPETGRSPDGLRLLRHTMTANTVLEAICATVRADEARFADIGMCKLETCKRFFERTSKHERHYCCTDHARQEAKRMKKVH